MAERPGRLHTKRLQKAGCGRAFKTGFQTLRIDSGELPFFLSVIVDIFERDLFSVAGLYTNDL